MAAKKLEAKDQKKVNEQIKDIRELIAALEKAGAVVPDSLTKSLKYLQLALDTGEDLGNALGEASAALAALEKDLMSACKNIDEAMEMVCEAKVARMWQVRNIKFTLSFKNPDSVSAKFLQKTIQRYMPAKICQHWDYCRKKVGK